MISHNRNHNQNPNDLTSLPASAAIIRAEGEAEAAELISKAMLSAGTGLIEVRRIDTAKDVAAILSRSRNVTYLPNTGGGSNMLLGLNSKD